MAEPSETAIWGTWEDLLLAFAVRRHGTTRWDSVAAELRARSSSGHLLTPRSCRLRYLHLQHRFSSGDDPPAAAADVPWLEDLRRLRVDELRRSVHRSDVSIMSLQSKVKRLKEERAQSKAEEAGADLEEEGEKGNARETPEIDAGDPDRVSGRSSKESNSADPKDEAGQAPSEPPVPDPAAEGSYDGSTATRGESVAESKESGDALSSASLTKRRRGRRRPAGGGGGAVTVEPKPEKEDGSRADEGGKIESGPLVAFLEIATSDPHGSLFVRRLDSQKSAKYRRLIRRHMDLEMVRSKIDGSAEGGSYSSALEFFRDLLLLCSNAIVFYPKGSHEATAAVHLRQLIMKEISSTFRVPSKDPSRPPPLCAPKPPVVATKPKSKPEPSALEKRVPLVACRKQSSIAAKKKGEERRQKQQIEDDQETEAEDQMEKPTIQKAKGVRTNQNRGSNISKLGTNIKKGANSGAASLLERIRSSSPPESQQKVGRRKTGAAAKNAAAGRKAPTKRVGRPPKRAASSPAAEPPAKRGKETETRRTTTRPQAKRRGRR